MNLTKILSVAIIALSNVVFAQNMNIEQTLQYINSNAKEDFRIDSHGFIYNSRYKFHASEVSASGHMNIAVRIFCPSYQYGMSIVPAQKCIQCLNKDCYEGTYGGQKTTQSFYINVDSSYDENRITNALNHLFKLVKKKYPKRGGNDPFAN